MTGSSFSPACLRSGWYSGNCLWDAGSQKYLSHPGLIPLYPVLFYLPQSRSHPCLGAADACLPWNGAGLCVHTTAFFTKSFAQSFESISPETIEALEVTGAGRLSIFFNAVLPAAFSQIVAWSDMRLETNFSECAILGMVGAGGVGYVISNSLQGYDYGTAGIAILLVFAVAYGIERVFVRIKKRFY